MIRPFVEHGYTEEEALADADYNGPLVNLIAHWQGKGYTPYYIN